MLNKKSTIVLTLVVLALASCSGVEDTGLVEGSQFQQNGQRPPEQQAPQQQSGQAATGQQVGGNSQLAQSSQAPDANALPDDNQNIVTSSGAAASSANVEGLFSSNVTITYTDTLMIIESDGLPSHDIGASTTPNTATAQSFRFEIPLNPQLASTPTDTPMGPIGITLSGAVFYNGYTSDGFYAVELEILDNCGGHADGRGVYHYHEESACIEGNLIGYAFDGFEVRKSIENDGSAVTGLDECNGHDHDGEYHYHATNDPSKPLIGCYSGVVETSNTVGGGRPGNG